MVGIADPEASAGAAASLANQNKKTIEFWKPGDIPAANKAALLAKDYKAAPLWQPELSSAGSKAALLAAREGGDVKIWRPEINDAGNSAAGQAMRMKGLSPALDYGYTEDGGKRAMMAATQSMASSRKRAGSTPVDSPSSYPDSKNSAINALKAATSVSNDSHHTAPATRTGPAINAGKIHNAAITNLSREMYTSHPPVAPEVEEKNRQAGLRASAVAMAQQMYNIQQRAIEAAAYDQGVADSRYGAAHAHNRPASVMSDESRQAPRYANLQEAAQKLAAERLAKLHDEHAAYRTYYGTQSSPQGRRLSVRGHNRTRASSDGEIGEDYETRSRQIRSDMSLFTDRLAQVDSKKRQKDRDSLMAAAKRNVEARMHGIDEKVFNETGKVSPAMMAEWEAKARAKADADSSARMVNYGKVNIGGGRYMDQAEIDVIAAAKVQPTIDEVTLAAERQRARDEELRQQQLERERLTREKEADQRERDARTKEAWKRFKGECPYFLDLDIWMQADVDAEEEKRDARARKEEEKVRKLEERRLRDEERRKSREAKVATKRPGDEELVAEAVVAEPVTDPEPPVLEHITHVQPDIAGMEPKSQPLPIDEEKAHPTVGVVTEKTEKGPKLEPAATSNTTSASGEYLGDEAAAIARRVFDAPVENESISGSGWEPPAVESQEAANATETVEEAPVVAAEIALMPAVGVPLITEPTSSPAAMESLDTIPEPSSSTKHEMPVAARIAPVAPTTETIVTGGTSPKAKDSKGVSSWLKTKFRRSSKAAKPEPNAQSMEPKEKTFVGGANFTNSGVTKTSSEHGEASVREVAMAGKGAAVARSISNEAPIVTPTEDTMDDASPQATGIARHHTPSLSISSLSSDEDTRGRSAVPRDHNKGLTQAEFIRQETGKQSGIVDPALGGSNVDPALTTRREMTGSSSGGGDQEFEEARDTFDSEKLQPPDVVGKERKSDSPARDSKFLEDL